ncbi:MAG: DoxX family protein [Solirubrobacteraceae bacterium]|nr:DoxX family protein [Solirubrobacteraceae bacterium]
MDVALWIVAGLAGLVFFLAGFLKLTKPWNELHEQMPWTVDVTAAQVKLIGVAELLGGLGLILPGAFDTATWLTPVAAAGLVLTMAVAAAMHRRRGDGPENLLLNAILGGMAFVVLVGRTVIETL